MINTKYKKEMVKLDTQIWGRDATNKPSIDQGSMQVKISIDQNAKKISRTNPDGH